MFEFLIKKLKAHPRKIVFTEGTDPRILEAAARLLSATFLMPVLVGNREEILAAAAEIGFNVKGAEILDPETFEDMDKMVAEMVALRKGKMTEDQCRAALKQGNYFGTMLVKMGEADCLLGGCEETTTGIIRLEAMNKAGELKFPMVRVNNADCKHLFDNRYGTGQSVWDGINRTTNLIVAGKIVVVAGYGWCGKGTAMRAKGLGARVIVTEIDPIKAIEAVMDGFDVMPMNEAAKVGDFFVTVTGCDKVIDEEDFKVMKDGAILCNAGHFDCEIDMARLREIAVETREQRKNIMGYKLPTGQWIFILAEGRLVNLAAGDGHPAEIMDMSFAIQALSAKYLVEHGSELTEKLIDVPVEVDRDVAKRKLAFLGKEIDVLTPEQEKYLNSYTL